MSQQDGSNLPMLLPQARSARTVSGDTPSAGCPPDRTGSNPCHTPAASDRRARSGGQRKANSSADRSLHVAPVLLYRLPAGFHRRTALLHHSSRCAVPLVHGQSCRTHRVYDGKHISTSLAALTAASTVSGNRAGPKLYVRD